MTQKRHNDGHEPDQSGYTDKESEDKTSPLVFEVLESGSHKEVVAIVSEHGTCQASQYLADLPSRDQVQFKARLERYTQVGFLRSPDEMRVIEGLRSPPRVHEIKTRSGHRMFGIEDGRRFIASHIARKPKPKAVIKHAVQAQEDYESAIKRERQNEGKQQ